MTPQCPLPTHHFWLRVTEPFLVPDAVVSLLPLSQGSGIHVSPGQDYGTASVSLYLPPGAWDPWEA